MGIFAVCARSVLSVAITEQHESLLSSDVAPGSINSATADRSADHAGPTSTASRETARRRAKPPSALSYRPTHVEPAAVTTESRVKLATVCRTIITVLEDMEASSSAIEQLPITRLLDSFRHSAGAAITAMAALQSQGWTMRQGIENWEQASQITEDAFRNYEVPQGGLRDPGA